MNTLIVFLAAMALFWLALELVNFWSVPFLGFVAFLGFLAMMVGAMLEAQSEARDIAPRVRERIDRIRARSRRR